MASLKKLRPTLEILSCGLGLLGLHFNLWAFLCFFTSISKRFGRRISGGYYVVTTLKNQRCGGHFPPAWTAPRLFVGPFHLPRRLSRPWTPCRFAVGCPGRPAPPHPRGEMLPGCPTPRPPSYTGRGCSSAPYRLRKFNM